MSRLRKYVPISSSTNTIHSIACIATFLTAIKDKLNVPGFDCNSIVKELKLHYSITNQCTCSAEFILPIKTLGVVTVNEIHNLPQVLLHFMGLCDQTPALRMGLFQSYEQECKKSLQSLPHKLNQMGSKDLLYYLIAEYSVDSLHNIVSETARLKEIFHCTFVSTYNRLLCTNWNLIHNAETNVIGYRSKQIRQLYSEYLQEKHLALFCNKNEENANFLERPIVVQTKNFYYEFSPMCTPKLHRSSSSNINTQFLRFMSPRNSSYVLQKRPPRSAPLQQKPPQPRAKLLGVPVYTEAFCIYLYNCYALIIYNGEFITDICSKWIVCLFGSQTTGYRVYQFCNNASFFTFWHHFITLWSVKDLTQTPTICHLWTAQFL